MSRFNDAIRATLNPARNPARDLSFQAMFEQGLDLAMTRRKAGVNVTTATASQLTAVYACWRIISEAIATLPRAAEYETEGRWLDAANQPAWLNTPNETDTWVEMLGQTMVSLLAGGDAYNMIVWNTAADGGGVKEIIVLNPTTCRRVSDTTVTVTPTDGTPPRDYRVLTASSSNSRPVEILHLRGMGHPGARVGMSPIEACAETIGVSLAAQRYGASFFANDGTPSGVLEVPPETDLSDTGRKALRESWAELHSGSNNAKKIGILTRGVKFSALQVSPNEAQFLETRKMGVQEIARLYGTPPHLIGDTTNTTGWGTGMAEQNTAFVIHTLRPWLERLEARYTLLYRAELMRQGMPASQTRIALHEEALLRGSPEKRWEVLRKNVASGLLTADEARRQEGFPSLPDGAGAVPWIPLSQYPQTDELESEPSNG